MVTFTAKQPVDLPRIQYECSYFKTHFLTNISLQTQQNGNGDQRKCILQEQNNLSSSYTKQRKSHNRKKYLYFLVQTEKRKTPTVCRGITCRKRETNCNTKYRKFPENTYQHNRKKNREKNNKFKRSWREMNSVLIEELVEETFWVIQNIHPNSPTMVYGVFQDIDKKTGKTL